MKLKKIESRQTTAKYVPFIELKPAEQKAILKRASELSIVISDNGDITEIDYDTFQIPDTISTKIKTISFKETGKYNIIFDEPVYRFDNQKLEWVATHKITASLNVVFKLIDSSPLVAITANCFMVEEGVPTIKNEQLFEAVIRKFKPTVAIETLFDNNGETGVFYTNHVIENTDDCARLLMVSNELIKVHTETVSTESSMF